MREKGPDLMDEVSDFRTLHPSAHALQNLIVHVLDGKIEVGADLFFLSHEFPEVRP